MAKLHGSAPAWTDLGDLDKLQFLRRLRAKRDDDLSEPSTFTKKRRDRKTLADKIADELTPEEAALMKELGLSNRELKSLLEI
jgi:hypothetical protein